jgi:hypothetical protein
VELGLVFAIGGVTMALAAQGSLPAQERAVSANPQPSLLAVPFIGCRSDGQLGPIDAPSGRSKSVPISPAAAQQLAYYRAADGFGVLAPRGWHCFGASGSDGQTLFVSPAPIDTKNIFSTGPGLAGPAIQLSYSFGDTSGRFIVAEIIARVFPAYRAFVTGVMRDYDQPEISFAFGSYPADTLTYTSKNAVEYRTPAQKDGLGTHSRLRKNGSPIHGVAILIGETPDLLLLSVRLPPELNGLTTAIVRQIERDAAGPARD